MESSTTYASAKTKSVKHCLAPNLVNNKATNYLFFCKVFSIF